MDSWDKGSRRRVPRRQAPLTVRSATPVWVKPDTNRPGGSDAWPTSCTSVPQHVSVGRIDSSTRFPTTGNPHPGESMTKLTTQGQKDSANTDLPQFHDPDDQVIGLDTDDTVPPDETDIQNDPETETIEIDPEEAAVLAYFTNA